MPLPAQDSALEMIEPSKQTLDLSAPAIASQRMAVLCCGSGTIGPVRGDQFDALLSELLIERIAVLGKISDILEGIYEMSPNRAIREILFVLGCPRATGNRALAHASDSRVPIKRRSPLAHNIASIRAASSGYFIAPG
jgi:hypothetical protein